MKQLQEGKRGKPRKKTELLAEGIIPLKRNGHRDWESMSDDDLVEYVRQVIDKTGFGGRGELQMADAGLYHVLRRRKLLGRVFPGSKRRSRGFFTKMSDDEVVEHANGVVLEEGFKRRFDLAKADSGLYYVLRKRKLLGRVEFEKTRRSWTSMRDDEIVEYALGVIGEKNLKGRKDLYRTDSGLYDVLRKRKLLDLVFAPLESQKKREAVQQVVDAMKEFDA